MLLNLKCGFYLQVQEYDSETGNYYYGARYYSPKYNLMLSVDPAYEMYPGVSPFAYTLQNPVRYVDPTGMFVEDNDDWIYDKQDKKYVWKEDVHSQKDIKDKERFEYVGSDMDEVQMHFENRLSLGQRVKRTVTGNINPNMDIGSYVSAKVTPKLEQAVKEQRLANRKFITSNDDFTTEFFYPEIDLNIGLDLKSGILSSNSYYFESFITIEGVNISFQGEYIVRNKEVNYINRVDASRNTFATPFGELYSNPVIFSAGRAPAVIINLNKKSDQERIKSFMWNF